MTSWRTSILSEFTPQVSRLTLVADPDALMTEEGVLQGIRERGFELIAFEDPVAFRYAYESKYRALWDQGQSTELVVALRTQDAHLRFLPFDLLTTGRQIRFSLDQIFPSLSNPVVECLDRADFESLHAAQQQHTPGQLGVNATKDFILRHVFGFAPETVRTEAALLRCLLAKHYRNRRIPLLLEDRIIALLRQNEDFRDWPLEQIVPDRPQFLGFIQERWPTFLTRIAQEKGAHLEERHDAPPTCFRGPTDLPLGDHDVRVYLHNMFAEGLLHPIQHDQTDTLSAEWVSVGLRIDPHRDATRRFEGLASLLTQALPSPQDRHQEWLDFALRWSELEAAWQNLPPEHQAPLQTIHHTLDLQVDERYQEWLTRRFATLHNQPPVPPVMVHHIPRFLSREMERDPRPTALVVLDGLSLPQWLVLQECLATRDPKCAFRRQAVFAWVPTITPISRQAIFAGTPPLLFPRSLLATDRDAAHWKVFWLNQGLAEHEIFHALLTGNEDPSQIDTILPGQSARALGIVVTKPDKIMHGMQLGSAGMHSQIRQWGDKPFLYNLLRTLAKSQHRVFLTSDHGNIEAQGCGSPAEGMLAETRGQRARIYNQASIRDHIRQKYPSAIAWEPTGLPTPCFPLLAPYRRAFAPPNATIVCHGGTSLAETVVPLVEATLHE